MSTTPPIPREDCDELLSEVLPFTERFLQKHKAFHPLGAVMKTDGTIVWVGVQREEDFPKGTAVLADLLGAFRDQAKRGEIRAAIVLYDVTTRDPGSSAVSDAICADCFHSGDYAKRAYFPYHFSDTELVFGEASACDTDNIVFEK